MAYQDLLAQMEILVYLDYQDEKEVLEGQVCQEWMGHQAFQVLSVYFNALISDIDW